MKEIEGNLLGTRDVHHNFYASAVHLSDRKVYSAFFLQLMFALVSLTGNFNLCGILCWSFFFIQTSKIMEQFIRTNNTHKLKSMK